MDKLRTIELLPAEYSDNGQKKSTFTYKAPLFNDIRKIYQLRRFQPNKVH